jgi:predicted nucleotidyltransferase
VFTLKRNDAIGYAAAFVSFMLERLGTEAGIRSIILFGSSVSGDVGRESDIDVFVNAPGERKAIEKKIKKLQEEFFDSPVYTGYWRMLGVKNSFHVIVDNLDEYGMKESIISQGIVLFGKYLDIPEGHALKSIIYWKGVKPEKKRVTVHRKLFGYSFRGKRYPGMLEKRGGQALSAGCIIIDAAFEREFLGMFSSLKISVKTRKVIELA